MTVMVERVTDSLWLAYVPDVDTRFEGGSYELVMREVRARLEQTMSGSVELEITVKGLADE